MVHAIAYTHHHADHLFGLDDARMFPQAIGGPVPIFCELETEETIRRVFHYAFEERASKFPAGGVPKIQFERIAPGVPFEVLGQTILPIRLDHGRFKVLGFRIGDLAYCTDVSHDSRRELADARRARHPDPRRAPGRAPPDAFQPGAGPGGDRAIEAQTTPISPIFRTGSITRRRRPPCPRAWLWPTMGSRWSFDRQRSGRDGDRHLADAEPVPYRPALSVATGAEPRCLPTLRSSPA